MRQCVAIACGRDRPDIRPGAESEGFGTFDLPKEATGAGEGIRTLDPNVGNGSAIAVSRKPDQSRGLAPHAQIGTVKWWDRRLRALS